jgi:hypothetical protein
LVLSADRQVWLLNHAITNRTGPVQVMGFNQSKEIEINFKGKVKDVAKRTNFTQLQKTFLQVFAVNQF